MWLIATTSVLVLSALLVVHNVERRTGPARREAFRRPLGLVPCIALGAWFGLLTGLGEAYYLLARALIEGQVIPGLRYVSRASLWMAPVAETVAFAVGGAAYAIASRLVPALASRRLVLTAFTFPMLLTWVMVTNRLFPWAALALAAGLAIRLGIWLGPAFDQFRPVARRGTVVMLALLLLAAAWTTFPLRWREHRALERLRDADPEPSPNVLFIVLDTQRAASTSLYTDAAGPTTPELEHLARSSIVFERAVAPASWTLPSHATMFTGLRNEELGTGLFDPLDHRYLTLAEALQERGYVTAGFVANIEMLGRLYGLDQGFIHYEAQPVDIGMLLASSWLTRTIVQKVRGRLGHYGLLVRKRAPSINRAFLDWLDVMPGRPFLAFLNYYDTHLPYDGPDGFERGVRNRARLEHLTHGDSARLYSERELRELEESYASAVRYLSRNIGSLVDQLDRRGLLDSTLIVLTSDHGESFGEHGRLGHGSTLYMPQVHVPLLIRPPGGTPARRVAGAVGLADLPATILSLIGAQDTPFPGHPLLTSPRGETGLVPGRSTPAISEGSAVGRPWYSVILGDEHYVRRADGREELYRISGIHEEKVPLGDSEYGLAAFRRALRSGGSRDAPP